MPEENEQVMKKIEHIVEDAMHRYMGVTIQEINKDISSKLTKNPLLEFNIDTDMRFKEAKKRFKKLFLQKLLQTHLGNISEVAKIADIDRRSIHRLINETGIEIDQIRHEMIKPYTIKKEAINHIISGVLENYKTIIHPSKLEELYKNVHEVTEDILEEAPINQPSLKDAEEEFEKAFLKKALEENKFHITKTAKKIGLRYETLHRKAKKSGII